MSLRTSVLLLLAGALAGCMGISKPRSLPAAPLPGAGDHACLPGTPILVGEVLNARDLGGTPIAPDGRVACGALYRGAPLADLSPRGCADFARLGIRTVIDLRTEGERLSRPEADCVDAGVVLAPLPVPYGLGPTDYIADLNTTESIAAAFRALGDDAAYPIYFHCTFGRDRTGVLAAVILRALGTSRVDVMREYGLSQTAVGAYPASLEAVLDEMDRVGGADAYLTASGISDPQLAVLRARTVVR